MEYVVHGIAKNWTRLNDLHFTLLHTVQNDYNGRISKEIVENYRMGKTRELVMKIRDTKGTSHAKMGSIKEGMA